MLRFIHRSIMTVKAAKIRNTYFLPFILALLVFCCSGLFNTASAASSTTLYVDAKLGFSIQVPTSWVAHPHPPLQATLTNTDVLFTNANTPDTQVEINVIRANNVGKDFGKGQTLFTINKHQAFSADTASQKQSPIPTARRIMLVGNDYVVATWLSPDAAKHGKQLEQILASYQSQSNATNQLKIATINAAATAASCSSLFTAAYNDPYGGIPNPQGYWGTTQVAPTDPIWTAHFSSGSSVCDNFVNNTDIYGYSGYYFQCVELANRFIGEQWGLPATYTDAGQFLDYSNGQNNPVAGGIYSASGGTLPASAFQVSTDGSQMPYQDTLPSHTQVNFEPSPGDLIVYQDVNDTVSWTSGLYVDPTTGLFTAGHIAVIVNVTSNSVEVAQQNYEPNSYLATLSMTKGANGYQITPPDKSYDSHRIVRGWIHLTANPNSPTPPPPPSDPVAHISVAANSDGHLEAFARDTNGYIWHNFQTAPNGPWSGWSQMENNYVFSSDPVVGTNQDGRLEVFARGTDSSQTIWHNYESGGAWSGWLQLQAGYSFKGTPAVALDSTGRLELFVRGADGNIWHDYQGSPGGSWSGWGGLSSGYAFSSDPAVGTDQDGRLEVFARGTDSAQTVWHDYQTSLNGPWSGWSAIQTGVSLTGTPAVGLDSTGRLEIFARSPNGYIWHNYQTSANGPWSTWNQLVSGYVFSGDPAVGFDQDGRMEVFARGSGSSESIWHSYQSSLNGPWTTWADIQPGYTFQGVPATSNEQDGRLGIFGIGSDGYIWHDVQSVPNGGFSGWVRLQNSQNGFTF
ncbi:hypothetical protein ccbrp13_37870 [Ktedonobacteria bacterium brp13]|nr:hypothetical protein ccbrp13_37870 [Ktedonobacteria bacterium brp13]